MALFEYRSAMKFRQALYKGIQAAAEVLPVSARAGDGIAESWQAITKLHSKLKVQIQNVLW